MIVRFDPVMRCIVSTESGHPELASVLAEKGIHFVETPSIPGPIELLAVDEFGGFVQRGLLPEECRLESYTTDDPEATVPAIPGLPEDAVVEPPVGTPLTSGDTYVTVRAPYCLDHRFVVHRWTDSDQKDALTSWAANHRWELETAGAPFRGYRVATDDRSKLMMVGSVIAAQMTPDYKTVWQFLDGSLSLTGADVTEMSLMTQRWVNGLFDVFAEVRALIDSGEITSTSQISERFAATQPGSRSTDTPTGS